MHEFFIKILHSELHTFLKLRCFVFKALTWVMSLVRLKLRSAEVCHILKQAAN